MRDLFRRVFGIFPGEGKNVARFLRLAIVWAIGSCIAETLAMGLFTEKIGAKFLPETYVITSLVMMSVSCLYVYFLRFTTPYKIMKTTMLVAAIIYSSISITFFTTPPKWFWYFLQIFSHSFGSALIACYWIFLDQYHDLQDAKRIYGVYNAAYFLGYTISGTLINLTYHRVGPKVLFAIVVVTMAHSIMEAKHISKKVPAMDDDGNEDIFAGSKKRFITIIKEFIRSPFALSLVAMSLIIQLLRTSTEYSYMETFEKIFKAGTSEILKNTTIPEFLGKCKAYISAANIIIGMFFYRNFIRRVGLGNMILLPPIYFLFLYFNWTIYDTLLIAVFGVIAVEGILFTLEDNNFNLLINAAPAKLKTPLRIINDAFFEPVGMLFSAIFLLFLKSKNYWFGISLSSIFLILSFIVKHLYPKSIYLSLKHNTLHFERKTKDWISRLSKKEKIENEENLFDILKTNDENTKLLACKTLFLFNDKKAITHIIKCIDNLSHIGKIKALEFLEECLFSDHIKIIEMIKSWVKFSEDTNLVKNAKFYLAKKGFLSFKNVMKYLNSEDLLLRASAIIALKQSNEKTNPKETIINNAIAEKETQLLFKRNNINEILIGLDILYYDKSTAAKDLVIRYLTDTNLTLKRKASYTLLKTADESYIQYYKTIINEIKHSSDNIFSLNCIKALAQINNASIIKDLIDLAPIFRPNEKRAAEDVIIQTGFKAVPILISIIQNSHINERSRILACKALSFLSITKLKSVLIDTLNTEIQRAYFYFYYSQTIQKQYPLYDLKILKSALYRSYQAIIDFIIHLLGSASLIEDPDLLVKSLHHKNEKTHAHAIETLEKTIDYKMFLKINPLIDDRPLECKIKEAAQYIESKLTLHQLLDHLEDSNILFDKIIASHLKAKWQVPDWKQSLLEQIKKSDESYNKFAYELLKT